jgi:hypothetical protein
MNCSKIPFAELFESSHDEQLLKPVKDLVQQVRDAGIEVYALDRFAAPHVAALGRNGSSAVLSADGSESPRGIVLNISQSNQIANEAGVIDQIEALRTCLAHEWGHANAHQRRDDFNSEFLAWQFARQHSKLSEQDFDNLRRVCFLRESPQLTPEKVDCKPDFWKNFELLSVQIGYQMAWSAVQADIKKQNLKSWDILPILTEDCELPFDIAYPLSEGENVDYALLRLAVSRQDYQELDRLVKPKPTAQLRRVPEQPIV